MIGGALRRRFAGSLVAPIFIGAARRSMDRTHTRAGQCLGLSSSFPKSVSSKGATVLQVGLRMSFFDSYHYLSYNYGPHGLIEVP